MAYVISDSCVSCGTCESECPVSAISQGDSQYVISEGDGKYVIDADTCMDCGSCAGVCPAGAISQE
jgi:ferredoxin